MKKAWIAIIVLLVPLLIVIGTVLFLKTDKFAQNDDFATEDSSMPFSQIITCITPESLKAKAEEYKESIESDGDAFRVIDVNGWGYNFNISGVGDIDGNYARVESYCFLNEQKGDIDAEKLCEIVKTIVPGFIEIFGVADINGGYYICDNNGNSLDINSIASYDSVLAGSAIVQTSLKENEESYWELIIYSSPDNGPMCNINHYINDSDFASVSGIINLDN